MSKGDQIPRETAGGRKGPSSPKTSRPRARVPHSAPEKPRVSKDYRIKRVVDLMLAMEYERGVTPATLAAEWGVSVSLVEQDASEASRLLDLHQQPEAVKQFCMEHLHRVVLESGHDRVRAMKLALQATGNLVERVELSAPTRTTPDMYAAALEHPGFVQYLKEQGWRPPVAALLTEGSELADVE